MKQRVALLFLLLSCCIAVVLSAGETQTPSVAAGSSKEGKVATAQRLPEDVSIVSLYTRVLLNWIIAQHNKSMQI